MAGEKLKFSKDAKLGVIVTLSDDQGNIQTIPLPDCTIEGEDLVFSGRTLAHRGVPLPKAFSVSSADQSVALSNAAVMIPESGKVTKTILSSANGGTGIADITFDTATLAAAGKKDLKIENATLGSDAGVRVTLDEGGGYTRSVFLKGYQFENDTLLPPAGTVAVKSADIPSSIDKEKGTVRFIPLPSSVAGQSLKNLRALVGIKEEVAVQPAPDDRRLVVSTEPGVYVPPVADDKDGKGVYLEGVRIAGGLLIPPSVPKEYNVTLPNGKTVVIKFGPDDALGLDPKELGILAGGVAIDLRGQGQTRTSDGTKLVFQPWPQVNIDLFYGPAESEKKIEGSHEYGYKVSGDTVEVLGSAGESTMMVPVSRDSKAAQKSVTFTGTLTKTVLLEAIKDSGITNVQFVEEKPFTAPTPQPRLILEEMVNAAGEAGVEIAFRDTSRNTQKTFLKGYTLKDGKLFPPAGVTEGNFLITGVATPNVANALSPIPIPITKDGLDIKGIQDKTGIKDVTFKPVERVTLEAKPAVEIRWYGFEAGKRAANGTKIPTTSAPLALEGWRIEGDQLLPPKGLTYPHKLAVPVSDKRTKEVEIASDRGISLTELRKKIKDPSFLGEENQAVPAGEGVAFIKKSHAAVTHYSGDRKLEEYDVLGTVTDAGFVPSEHETLRLTNRKSLTFVKGKTVGEAAIRKAGIPEVTFQKVAPVVVPAAQPGTGLPPKKEDKKTDVDKVLGTAAKFGGGLAAGVFAVANPEFALPFAAITLWQLFKGGDDHPAMDNNIHNFRDKFQEALGRLPDGATAATALRQHMVAAEEALGFFARARVIGERKDLDLKLQANGEAYIADTQIAAAQTVRAALIAQKRAYEERTAKTNGTAKGDFSATLNIEDFVKGLDFQNNPQARFELNCLGTGFKLGGVVGSVFKDEDEEKRFYARIRKEVPNERKEFEKKYPPTKDLDNFLPNSTIIYHKVDDDKYIPMAWKNVTHVYSDGILFDLEKNTAWDGHRQLDSKYRYKERQQAWERSDYARALQGDAARTIIEKTILDGQYNPEIAGEVSGLASVTGTARDFASARGMYKPGEKYQPGYDALTNSGEQNTADFFRKAFEAFRAFASGQDGALGLILNLLAELMGFAKQHPPQRITVVESGNLQSTQLQNAVMNENRTELVKFDPAKPMVLSLQVDYMVPEVPADAKKKTAAIPAKLESTRVDISFLTKPGETNISVDEAKKLIADTLNERFKGGKIKVDDTECDVKTLNGKTYDPTKSAGDNLTIQLREQQGNGWKAVAMGNQPPAPPAPVPAATTDIPTTDQIVTVVADPADPTGQLLVKAGNSEFKIKVKIKDGKVYAADENKDGMDILKVNGTPVIMLYKPGAKDDVAMKVEYLQLALSAAQAKKGEDITDVALEPDQSKKTSAKIVMDVIKELGFDISQLRSYIGKDIYVPTTGGAFKTRQ